MDPRMNADRSALSARTDPTDRPDALSLPAPRPETDAPQLDPQPDSTALPPHNVLIWARGWLAPTAHVLSGYGLVRLIRDVLAMPSRVTLDAQGCIQTLMLSQAHPLAVK